MATIPDSFFNTGGFGTLEGALSHARYYHADHSQAFGSALPWDCERAELRFDLASAALGRCAMAAAAKSPLVLTLAEAQALKIVLGLGALALEHAHPAKGPLIPIFAWDEHKRRVAESKGLVLDPKGRDASIVCNPIGFGSHDPVAQKTARDALGVVKLLNDGAKAPTAPYLGDIPIEGIPGIVPAAAGAVLAGIAIIGAAAVVGVGVWRKFAADEEVGKVKAQWDGEIALAAQHSAQKIRAGIARLELEAKTGKKFDPLPIENEDTAKLIKAGQLSDGRWGSIAAIGAGVAVGGAGTAYALNKWGGGA